MDVSETQYFNADGFAQFGGLGASIVSGGVEALKPKKDSNKPANQGLGQSIVSGGLEALKPTKDEKPEKSDKPKSNTMLYVGLGVGYLLLVVLIIKVTKK